MKKKMYAIFLAACLFIGLAIPAFAMEFGDSALAGDASEITQLSFRKSSYTVKNGDTLNLADELTAYCGNSKICLYADYSWSATDSLSLGIDPGSGQVTAFENSGSITVTVTELTSGKKATVRVTATKGETANSEPATGFKFDRSSYTFYTGDLGDEQTVVRAIPTPVGHVFTDAQKTYLNAQIPGAFLNKGVSLDSPTAPGTGEDQNNLVYTVNGTLPETSISPRAVRISMDDLDFPNATDPARPYHLSRTVSFTVAKGVPARNLIKKGVLRLQVGQVADLNNYLQFPSSANYGKNCTFELTYASDSSTTYDYAVMGDDQHTILGVAVGKLKAIATLPSGNASAEIPIEIVARNASTSGGGDAPHVSGASVTPTIATLKVGATLTLTAKNVPAGSNVSWFMDSSGKAELTENGTTATVKGLTPGTVKVIAYADNAEIGASTLTITSGGAVTPSPLPPPPPISDNPLTGDSWFSHLF